MRFHSFWLIWLIGCPCKTEPTSLKNLSLTQSRGKLLTSAIVDFPKRRFLMICNAYCPQKDGYRHFQRYGTLNAFARGECESRDVLQCKPIACGREIQNKLFLEGICDEITKPYVSETEFFYLNIDLLILKMKVFSERLTGSIFKCSIQ